MTTSGSVSESFSKSGDECGTEALPGVAALPLKRPPASPTQETMPVYQKDQTAPEPTSTTNYSPEDDSLNV